MIKFKPGKVSNTTTIFIRPVKPAYSHIKISFPSRLNAMAMDPSRISIKKSAVYTAGEVVLSVGIYKIVSVGLRRDKKIIISNRSKRHPIILHSALLMQKALNTNEGFDIDVSNEGEIRHAGLGSSSGLIASVACAINELYGCPMPKEVLLKYLAQNHGEEIDGNNEYLYPVQCLGGSAAAGLYKSGFILLAGESTVIAAMDIPNDYKAIIGIPKDFIEQDAKSLMAMEIKGMANFVRTGKKFGKIIAYNILHRMLPAMVSKDLSVIGDVIYEYRFKMGSIKNCSYAYRKLPKLMDSLTSLKKKGLAPILSISSVGPGVFAVAKDKDVSTCSSLFKRRGLDISIVPFENRGYRVLSRKRV